MEPTEIQLKRKTEIHEYGREKVTGIQTTYRETDYSESMRQMDRMQKYGTSEEYGRYSFEEDAAKLGSKTVWKPSDAEKRKNKKIEESRKLTQKATADTLELYNVMQERKKAKAEEEINRIRVKGNESWQEKKVRARSMFETLKAVRLEKRMLTTANVKMHFKEYMDLVDTYKELNELAKEEKARRMLDYKEIVEKNAMNPKLLYDEKDENGNLIREGELDRWERDKPWIEEELMPLRDAFGVLQDRMGCFLARNRLDENGNVLPDKAKTRTFVYNKKVDDIFRADQSSIQRKTVDRTMYDPDQLDLVREDILNEKVLDQGNEVSRLELVLKDREMESDNDMEQALDHNMSDLFLNMNPAKRVKSITSMRKYVSRLQTGVDRMEEYLKELSGNAENQDAILQGRDMIRQQLMAARRELVITKAVLVLAEAEGRYVLARNETEKKACLEAMADVWEDFVRIRQRMIKESQPLTGSFHFGPDISVITPREAMNTESDKKNYEFKADVFEVANELGQERFGELSTAIRKYATVTHYSEEPREETRLLMELISARNAYHENPDLIPEISEGEKKALKKLDKLLFTLQHGENAEPFPAWEEIPESMKEDCIDESLIPAGETVADLTDQQLAKVDQIPEHMEADFHKGSHRNAALMNMSTWVRIDAKTPLFSHEPTVNDLRQGKISNCYMVASTTGLINLDPQIIKKCIQDNGDGTVTVRLYKESKRLNAPRVPVYVRIPKRIPKLMTGGEIGTDGALWMQLIERAAAQVGMFREERKGYQSLWYGRGDEWLEILLGTPENVVMNRENNTRKAGFENDNAIFGMMEQAKKNNLIIHAGTKENAEKGMNSGHAYTVLGAKYVGTERFVTLRNPYANMSRTVSESGKVSMTTDYFTSSADETFGQFDMPFEEFMKTMETISYTDMNKAFPVEMTEKTENGIKKMVKRTMTEIAADEAQGLGDVDFVDEEFDNFGNDQTQGDA